MQLREDLEREKRAMAGAEQEVAAKQSQVEYWKVKAERAAIQPDSITPSAQLDCTDGMGTPVEEHSSSAVAAESNPGGSVTDIISKWRSVSMKQVNETHSLAEQLAIERKAVQSMRAQALMLERQVETAEDQLESERASATAREGSLRTQLSNLESQVAEQESLLQLKSAAVSAAEAQSTKTSAELIAARERVRTLEDMVKATETELQSAIQQMSEMHSVVMATDVKLCDAQEASADRDAAIRELHGVVATLNRIMLKPVAWDLSDEVSGSVNAAERAARQVAAALLTLEADIKSRRSAVDNLSEQCEALEAQVEYRNTAVQDLKDKLRDAMAELDSNKVQLRQVCSMQQSSRPRIAECVFLWKTVAVMQETAALQSTKQQLERHQHHSEASVAEAEAALSESKALAAKLSDCERQNSRLQSIVDEQMASVQRLTDKLETKREEMLSLQHQLLESEDKARRTQDQVSDAEAEVRALRVETGGAADALSKASRDADSCRSQAQSLAARLEDAESRLASMQDSLDKRNQEVGAHSHLAVCACCKQVAPWAVGSLWACSMMVTPTGAACRFESSTAC